MNSKSLTLAFYRTAREWLRFDGYNPYDTAPRIAAYMSEVRYIRERAALGPTDEYAAHAALIGNGEA